MRYGTQFHEKFDGNLHPPRPFESLEAARAHAKDVTFRKEGTCAVVNENGVPVETYEDGELKKR